MTLRLPRLFVPILLATALQAPAQTRLRVANESDATWWLSPVEGDHFAIIRRGQWPGEPEGKETHYLGFREILIPKGQIVELLWRESGEAKGRLTFALLDREQENPHNLVFTGANPGRGWGPGPAGAGLFPG